jgi:predicted AAA+ superfamily ATPase
MASETREAKVKNDHVWDYLTYYLGLPHSPNFAVLLSGPWGVGKTFLVKRFLAKYFEGQKDQYVYVSLYGLRLLKKLTMHCFKLFFRLRPVRSQP